MVDDSFLFGTLVIRATRRKDNAPLRNARVHIDASCGSCCCGTWVSTDADGIARTELPIGKVTVTLDRQRQETWIALDQETCVDFER